MDNNALQYHLTKVFSELKAGIVEEIISQLKEQGLGFSGTPVGQEKLLTDKQLCELLQISTSHLSNFRKANPDFPSYAIGKNVRYKLSEVEEFLKFNQKK
ncbi:helix-turn-helix domain-containing protein [Chryseobacterium rhizosphaerae]|uniref:helix-turn-helix domain-containing protein n=1 Tax=Chryseobacterium rhizosphaerae TaxID=395937 RepID=UPI002358AC5A|nr:helix-turn-helix domain-containing protein [Chryseobacterium rhizosphaerae]MDC8099169.1 helix-turn-helix domain-containing protein [Chryseobacterium rhizosphaerae]